MKNSEADAKRWLSQAINDLAFSRLALRESYFTQTCFMSHQVAEKALKSLAYFRGDRYVMGHSLSGLVASLEETHPEIKEFHSITGRLDQFYVPTRYPDALPGGTPFEAYDREQAEEAVASAARIVAFAEGVINS